MDKYNSDLKKSKENDLSRNVIAGAKDNHKRIFRIPSFGSNKEIRESYDRIDWSK